MPEGPSIVLLKEAVKPFTGKKVIAVTGNTKTIDKNRLLNQKIISFKSWGKHFLICFKEFTVRIHFMLFGSYLINDKKNTPVRLGILLSKGEINFYACSIKIIEADIDDVYDWSADVMNDSWNAKNARKKLKEKSQVLICDALLNQDIFAGVGNIIKNEILYKMKIHPESIIGKIPAEKITGIIKEVRSYSFDFLKWKRNFELKKHWLAHTKKTCVRCNIPLIKKYAGSTKRRTFFCDQCQRLYK